MKLFNSTTTLALLAMTIAIVAIPGTASARSSVHIDLPHFSIGFHDDHYRHKRKYRKHKRYHRGYKSHRSHRRYDHHYDDGYYYDGYSSGYRYYRPRTRYYDRGYYNEICPTPGYSSRYYRNRGCYSHGDHYHCE